MQTNRAIHLVRRPVGMAVRDDFEVRDAPIPSLRNGEVRVAIRFVSIDPAMRGWMNDLRSYVEPVALESVMRAYCAGIVEASEHPEFSIGDAVTGILGVQTHAVVPGDRLVRVTCNYV